MRALLQRVSSARVSVDGEIRGVIERGLLILLGVRTNDTEAELAQLLRKIQGLRIFNDRDGKMNLSCEDIEGAYLVVSQFTLCANARKGKRPSYEKAMKPTEAEAMYESFCQQLAQITQRPVERGVFGAHMHVELINDGPVTIWLDTDEL